MSGCLHCMESLPPPQSLLNPPPRYTQWLIAFRNWFRGGSVGLSRSLEKERRLGAAEMDAWMQLDPAATFKQGAQAVTFPSLMKYLSGEGSGRAEGGTVGLTKRKMTENMLLFLFFRLVLPRSVWVDDVASKGLFCFLFIFFFSPCCNNCTSCHQTNPSRVGVVRLKVFHCFDCNIGDNFYLFFCSETLMFCYICAYFMWCWLLMQIIIIVPVISYFCLFCSVDGLSSPGPVNLL